jgi:cytochrome c551/c552
MPANEQTWRNLKALHVVFAVAAILLLVATVLMLTADHDRPWKKYARGFRELETWSAKARVQEQESKAYEARGRELADALAKARRMLDPALVEQMLAAVRTVPEDAEAAADAEAALAKVVASVKALPPQAEVDPAKVNAAAESGTADELWSAVFAARGDLLARLRDIAKRAKFREDQLAGALKLEKAQLDKNRADYELAIADEAPNDRQQALLAITDAKRSDVAAATGRFQEANTHRLVLDGALRRITAAEDAAAKGVDDHRGKLVQLQKTLDQRRSTAGKSLLEMPVLDAFNGPLRPDQIWLPELTLNNNFREVARFDRCGTCHRGMDKTVPGAPTDPAYPAAHEVAITLPTPAAPPEQRDVVGDGNDQLESLYGFRLAPQGLLNADDPTVAVVVPQSPAAEAGIQVGDVIEAVAGGGTPARQIAVAGLVETPAWGKPLALQVRRGVPQPYATHPRLDLFVGDSSPHPMKSFGCTICHQGQGSATAFKWVSHTPNSPKQAHEWHDEHGWFNNHHWILPMLPQRFEESSCLKCHHQVVDLEPSEKFPEPPAPKLVEGYHLIRQYGCYGCHEINGWAGPEKRIGPDMRLQPNFHEVAESLLADKGLAALGSTVERWVEEMRSSPDGRAARERLRDVLERDAGAGAEAKLSPRSHQLVSLLKDPETPGTFPKVGPSLRHAASKLGFDWTYSWLRNPQDFRPSTKMPRFFGLWDHLEGKGLEESKRYEPLEIRSMIHYIAAASAPFEYVPPHAGITAAADVDRGKKVFQLRGCLACHQHADFPEATSTHGPNLSRIGAKIAGHPRGKEWLYSWLREPATYHPRTLMPNVILEPVTLADGSVSDPAADAVAYLMTSTEGWKPENVPAAGSLTADERKALDELALMYLEERFPSVKAAAVLQRGLSAEMSNLQGDERMLVGLDGAGRDATLLNYVGKKTVAKLACYSCHDIPGFEDAKPAGAALADWGRKDPSRIAFEQVAHHVVNQLGGHHGHGGGHHGAGDEGTGHVNGDADLDPELPYGRAGDAPHFDPEAVDADTGFFVQKLLGHEREGFLWQKLRAPRSYDYKKAENKKYNERYRMPQFPFDAKQREAVMTFVLGLVAEPPAPKYVHRPSPREEARLQGLVVAEQYNCGGCHALEMDRWDVRYKPGALGETPAITGYPFLAPHFTEPQLQGALATDRAGRRRATLVGMPMLDEKTGRPQEVDEDGQAIEPDDKESKVFRPFMLWRDAIVDGKPWPVGSRNMAVPDDAVQAGRHYPGKGGDLARLLFPVVIADEKLNNPAVKGDDAWGWLPPPLVGEGRKVQSAWLHKFLLNPHPIRPPAVLRMPKFNFHSSEAAALVNYFAAVDGAESYVYDPRLDVGSLAETERRHPGHLDDALKIVRNNNYCIKCHLLGDEMPVGASIKALAPQLANVHERLRPDYVHNWIANPKRFLPYTGMPVNIPFDQPVSQELYQGTSEQQVEALTDLLMHYDEFAKRKLAGRREPARPVSPPAQSQAPAAESPPRASRPDPENRPAASLEPAERSSASRVALQ